MLTLAALFALPIIVSIVCKNYKITVFSSLCAIPACITSVLNLLGYSFAAEVDYAIFLVSILLCILCFIATFPSKKGLAVILCILITFPIIAFVTLVRDYSFEVTIDGEEYAASYCCFNVGPTTVGYHEKCNKLFYKYEPSFYSALLCMGSPECIGNCMLEYLEEGITEFYSSPEDAVDALRDS